MVVNEDYIFDKAQKSDGVSIWGVMKKSYVLEVPKKVYDNGIEMKVTEIRDSAFQLGNFEEARIADSVEVIGKWAFASCNNLKKINLPQSLKIIGTYAFHDLSLIHI